MQETILKAYAKLNLTLHVLGLRPDRYHEIDSIMVPITLFDELHLKKQQKNISVNCLGHAHLQNENNLAYHAACAYQKKQKEKFGVEITINKKIPLQAGLGGGSSDAACVLLGLQRLASLKLEDEQLIEIAKNLGADVPFFLKPVPQRARGIGEKLEVYPGLPDFWVVLGVAPFGLATAEVYKQLKYPLTLQPGDAKKNPKFLGGNVAQLASFLHNDLLPVAIALQPTVQKICETLKQEGAAGASMSGSGPSVFGLFSTEQQANRALGRLKDKWHWKFLVAKGITA